jgi:hypothetical protein
MRDEINGDTGMFPGDPLKKVSQPRGGLLEIAERI